MLDVCICISINNTYNGNDKSYLDVDYQFLVVTRFNCMHIVFLVNEIHNQRNYLTTLLLKICITRIFNILLQINLPTNLFCSVHISTLQRILSYALLILDKCFVPSLSCTSIKCIFETIIKKNGYESTSWRLKTQTPKLVHEDFSPCINYESNVSSPFIYYCMMEYLRSLVTMRYLS